MQVQKKRLRNEILMLSNQEAEKLLQNQQQQNPNETNKQTAYKYGSEKQWLNRHEKSIYHYVSLSASEKWQILNIFIHLSWWQVMFLENLTQIIGFRVFNRILSQSTWNSKGLTEKEGKEIKNL